MIYFKTSRFSEEQISLSWNLFLFPLTSFKLKEMLMVLFLRARCMKMHLNAHSSSWSVKINWAKIDSSQGTTMEMVFANGACILISSLKSSTVWPKSYFVTSVCMRNGNHLYHVTVRSLKQTGSTVCWCPLLS